jgi:hypothetical protein
LLANTGLHEYSLQCFGHYQDFSHGTSAKDRHCSVDASFAKKVSLPGATLGAVVTSDDHSSVALPAGSINVVALTGELLFLAFPVINSAALALDML